MQHFAIFQDLKINVLDSRMAAASQQIPPITLYSFNTRTGGLISTHKQTLNKLLSYGTYKNEDIIKSDSDGIYISPSNEFPFI